MKTPLVTRRQALAAGAVLFLGSRRVRSAPQARIGTPAVISHQPQYYHGWPTLARRKNGQLILVWSGAREAHVCPFGKVEMMTSNDEGKTWSWPRTLLDSAIDDRDAGVVETAKGTLLVTTFTSLAFTEAKTRPDQEKTWNPAYARLNKEQQKKDLGVWMIRSTDDGLSWSARYDSTVNSPHGPVLLKDGSLLYAGKELWTAEQRNGVCVSTDDGQSWKWLAEIPTRPGDDKKEYHELHAVETKSGSLLVQIRNHNKANPGETLQCESSDGGKTWSVPHPIGVWGLPSHLLRLRDGRLVMSYGHRRKPFGVQARLSEDHGRTWSEAITLADDGLGGDLGYPSTVELKDGSLLTVWYELMKEPRGRAVLRQVRWSIQS